MEKNERKTIKKIQLCRKKRSNFYLIFFVVLFQTCITPFAFIELIGKYQGFFNSDKITEKVSWSAGYVYTLTSEGIDGHGVSAKTTYSLNDSTSFNFEASINDNAGFSKEKKFLAYITHHFF